MEFRIKEICKEKGISMTMLADRLGIKPVALSQCLSGNPTIKRLQEIADILEVDIIDLFERKKAVNPVIEGCIFISGKAHVIKSRQELIDCVEMLSNK